MTEIKTTPLFLHDGAFADEDCVIHCAQQILQRRFERMSEPLRSYQQVSDFLKVTFQAFDRQVFSCLFLDGSHRVIALEHLFYGSLTNLKVATREVIRAALKHNCAGIVTVRSFPLGMDSVDDDDLAAALSLQRMCETFELSLVDHFLVCTDGIVSYVDLGYLMRQY